MGVEYFPLKEEALSQLAERTVTKQKIGERLMGALADENVNPDRYLNEGREALFKTVVLSRVENLDASENRKNATEYLTRIYSRYYTEGEKTAAVMMQEDKAAIEKALDARLGQQRSI